MLWTTPSSNLYYACTFFGTLQAEKQHPHDYGINHMFHYYAVIHLCNIPPKILFSGFVRMIPIYKQIMFEQKDPLQTPHSFL
mmetsp:Transcript_57081/g.66698  ORF Transcript_57081/g.66698 Transcript_57081/m.66698 type:complete len:82 (-) Transcript_57081:282-527(-)